MTIKISFETPETTPPVFLHFLHHLLKKYPLTHPNTDCTIVMKQTKTVDGRPGSFFGSRPFGRNYSRLMVALGRPKCPHQLTSVLGAIAHEYKHLLQHDEDPPVTRKGRANELEADLFTLRELFHYTGDPRVVMHAIRECYKGTQNFLAANPEIKAGLTGGVTAGTIRFSVRLKPAPENELRGVEDTAPTET